MSYFYQQKLKGGHVNEQVGLFIQYYKVNIIFQKLFLAKEVIIFHHLKNQEIQCKD